MNSLTKHRQVIFKQRTARHLAVKADLKWEYELGSIVFVNKEKGFAAVCWLQGHHSRTDDVKFEDIVALSDNRYKAHTIGSFTGKGRIIQKIVPEGT